MESDWEEPVPEIHLGTARYNVLEAHRLCLESEEIPPQAPALLHDGESAPSSSKEASSSQETSSRKKPASSRRRLYSDAAQVLALLSDSDPGESLSESDLDELLSDSGKSGLGDTSVSDVELSSSSDSSETDSDYDLSDPEGGCAPSSSDSDVPVSLLPTATTSTGRGHKARVGRGVRGGRGASRGRASRGHGGGSSQRCVKQQLTLNDISTPDAGYTGKLSFSPSRTVGTHLPDNITDTSEAAVFKLFFDAHIVQEICRCSDEYAEQLKEKKPVMYRYYKGMSPETFDKLIGIILHLGYRRIPQYRLAWSPRSLCYDPFVARVMSRNQFQGLLSFLHLVDAATEEELKKKGDKLAKVRPLNDHLQQRCLELYQPHAEISVDERMVRSKARFSFKQYIRNKPTKWGFKLWCLCDSHNGYTVNFTVYRGKKGEVRTKNGLGYDVVMDLSKSHHNQGYRIYMDNFYTSPVLIDDLYQMGTHGTGTLKTNRTGVPDEVCELNRTLSKKPRGSGVYVRASNSEAVYSVRKDTKCVTVLTSEHPGHSQGTVTGNWKEDGQRKKKDVPIPLPVYNYNKYMGGVDRSDQLLKNYQILRQTKKYWKTLLFHFLDLATVNAYILFKDIHPASKVSHFRFRENLVRALCQTPDPVYPSPGSGGRPAKDFTLKHYLTRTKGNRDCIYCKIVHGVRSRTTRECAECRVPLCFTGDKDCFVKYHHRNFRQRRQSLEEDRQRRATRVVKSTPSRPVGRPVGTVKCRGRGKRKRKHC